MGVHSIFNKRSLSDDNYNKKALTVPSELNDFV